MAILDAFRPAEAFEMLLEHERASLLAADFKALGQVLKAKQRLLMLVEKSNLPEAKLKRLAELSVRNQRLLLASAEGIRRAQKNLSSLKGVQQEFNVYQPGGSSEKLGHKPLTIKKKL